MYFSDQSEDLATLYASGAFAPTPLPFLSFVVDAIFCFSLENVNTFNWPITLCHHWLRCHSIVFVLWATHIGVLHYAILFAGELSEGNQWNCKNQGKYVPRNINIRNFSKIWTHQGVAIAKAYQFQWIKVKQDFAINRYSREVENRESS